MTKRAGQRRARLVRAALETGEAFAPILHVHQKLVGPVTSAQTLSEATNLLARPHVELDTKDVEAARTIRAIGMYALGLSARGANAPKAGTPPPEVWSLDEGALPGDPTLLAALRRLHRCIRASETSKIIKELPEIGNEWTDYGEPL